MSNNKNIISETESLQNWNNLPYISSGSMDYESIGQKLLSFSARVSSKKIKSAEIRPDDLKKIEKSAGDLFESPLLIKISYYL